jgi:hypothetical protein
MRVALLLPALLAVALPAVPATSAGQSIDASTTLAIGDHERIALGAAAISRVVLAITIPKVSDTTLVAWIRGDELFIPLAATLAFVGGEARPDGRDGWHVRLGAQPVRHLIHTNASLREAGSARTLGAAFHFDGVLVVDRLALEGVLGVSATHRPAEAMLRLEPSRALPVVDRAVVARQRAALQAAARDDALVSLPVVNDPGTGSITIDYDARLASIGPVRSTDLLLDVGAPFLRGVATAGWRAVPRGADRTSLGWYRTWEHGRWASLLQLGDLPPTSDGDGPLRGILLTNRPLHRPRVFDAVPFAGTLGEGWTVDAYRGGRLVAFDSAGQDGRFSLVLPVSYGENPIDLVAYGPGGEVREFSRIYRAVPSLVQPRSTEYRLVAGACRNALDACDAAGRLSIARGVSPHVTVRAGSAVVWRDGHADVSPQFGATVASATGVGVEYTESLSRGRDLSIRVEPSARHQAVLHHVTSRAPGVSAQRSHSLYFRRLAAHPGGLSLELEAVRDEAPRGRSTLRAGGAITWHGVAWRPRLSASRDDLVEGMALGAELEATLFPMRHLGPVLGSVWWRATGGLRRGDGLHRAELTAYRAVRTARLELTVAWSRDRDEATLAAGVVTALPSVRSMMRASSERGGRVHAGIGGSVLFDPVTGRTRLTSEPGRQRAGVVGSMWVDTDLDGIWDPEESPVAGARLILGGRGIRTDDDGRFEWWGLQPHEPVRVLVDTNSLRDPAWVPVVPGVLVTPAPGQLVQVSLPVTETAVLDGEVIVRGESRIDPRRLGLRLCDLRDDSCRDLPIFGDGGFYLTGLRPGRYQVRADPTRMAASGLSLVSPTFVLEGGAPPLAVRVQAVPAMLARTDW